MNWEMCCSAGNIPEDQAMGTGYRGVDVLALHATACPGLHSLVLRKDEASSVEGKPKNYHGYSIGTRSHTAIG